MNSTTCNTHRPKTVSQWSSRSARSFEGNTTRGRVSLWARTTWRNGSFVQVYVFFGSPRPSGAAIERAQLELDATRFPQWSIRS